MKYVFYGLLGACLIQAGPPTDPRLRPSSYPYISGDTFRNFCDHVYDETNVSFESSKVKQGDTIFVNGDLINDFFNNYHLSIPEPYILVAHNSDNSIPGNFAARYLDDPKLIMLFAQNIDRIHPKLKGIPIGFANYHWPHGKTETVNLIKEQPIQPRISKAYLNFLVDTNSSVRKPIWDYFVSQPFCRVMQKRTHAQYLQDMRSCMFVISPPGNGVDCHRHWEALHMGAISVMKHSTIDSLFTDENGEIDLPVILVNEWSEVTVPFLEEQERNIRTKKFNQDKLYVQYWLDKIANCQAYSRK